MNIKEFIHTILEFASKNKYPDIHLNTWMHPNMRDNTWSIISITEVPQWESSLKLPKITREVMEQIIIEIVWKPGFDKFINEMEIDSSYIIENGDRYRVNCYMDSMWYSIALRLIPSEIPSLEELWFGDQIKELCNRGKGLVLVTWPTGSWKSTNLAAMIDYINKTHKKHIITVEDPIEFAFKSEQSLINQREVGNHTKGFAPAIRAALREDPDVIMIWEMRDPETIKAAITLAETGHLVFSTLHTNDSVQTIDRIVDVFPWAQQKQIRMQLAMSIAWVVSQRLIPRSDKDQRVAAREVLISNDAVRNLIISWKTHQLYSVLEVWKKQWMILMDKYLTILYQKKMISKETLLSYVRDKESIEMMID